MTRSQNGLARIICGVHRCDGRENLTLHDLGDLFVPFSMQQVDARRVAAAGLSDRVVQRAPLRAARQRALLGLDPRIDERLAPIGSHDHITKLEIRRVLEQTEVVGSRVDEAVGRYRVERLSPGNRRRARRRSLPPRSRP